MSPLAAKGRLGLAIALVLSAGLGLAGSAAAQGGELQIRLTQVDTSRFPRVTVHISVTDAAGNPVGIDPSKLVLTEDGKRVEPEDVLGMGESESLTTLLVLDVSGSMAYRGKLAAAQEAAHRYIDQMRPGDQAGVLSFNTQVKVVQPITEDTEALRAAIDRLEAIDDTALYDAMDQAVELLQGLPGRKAVILLSDGMDNSSTQSSEAVLRRVAGTELSVSTIGFGDPTVARGSFSGIDEPLLSNLADEAGGVYGYAEDAGALTDLFERYGRALQSEYVITYVSLRPLRDGVNRSLSVRLETAGAEIASEHRYNPGGVVPEVIQPASWNAFALAMAALVGLLLLPGLMRRATELPQVWRGIRRKEAPGARGRIRLKEPTPRRVRLR